MSFKSSSDSLSAIPIRIETAPSAEDIANFNTEIESQELKALLVEVKQASQQFFHHGEKYSIDLTSLPLSEFAIAKVLKLLGQGELNIKLSALGDSEIYETTFSTIWVVRHFDEEDRVMTVLIEICDIPAIVLSQLEDIDDITRGIDQLIEGLHS